jgi:ubiquinone/menaquinone biosynthesis C-methylase UbiE
MACVLGSDNPEIKRLDHQASWLEEPTRLLLRVAGIEPGMRVLDLGTGLGHVAFAVADLVGPSGQVVGIDSADRMLAVASERAKGRNHVWFGQATSAAGRATSRSTSLSGA